MYITKDIVANENEFYDFHYIKALSEKYKIIYDPINPQYVMCNSNSKDYLKYECVRIILSGENLRVDFNLVDYAINFDFMDFGDRYMRAPLFYTIFRPNAYSWANRSDFIAQKREKFCCILVSNGGRNRILFRNLAFAKISEYKRVDSGGSWNNNVGFKAQSKADFLREYKFNICFENASYPGYLSEKLYEAYMYGCVPIYWGDTSLRVGCKPAKVSAKEPFMQPQSDDKKPSENIDMSIPKISPHLLEYRVNPKAYINAHNFANLSELVDEVRRIDSDKDAYLEMLQQDLFLDNFEPFKYYEKKIFNFLDSIFSQEYESAFRRGNSAMLYLYNKKAQDSYKLSNLRSKIFHYPRNFFRKYYKK